MTEREDRREAFDVRELRAIDRPAKSFDMRSAVTLSVATSAVVVILASVLLFLILSVPR
jgi:hypothetical protein